MIEQHWLLRLLDKEGSSFSYNRSLVIILLLIGCAPLVYYTGGIKYVYAHTMYLPIVLAAIFFKVKGGVIVGLIGGIILGPFMPIDTLTGELQETANWIYRIGFFIFIGALVGYVNYLLQQAYKGLKAKINECILTEKSLRESEMRYRSLIENITIGIIRGTPGPEGRFLLANQAFFKMFGIDKEDDLPSLRIVDLYVVPEDRKAFSDKLVKEGKVSGIELRLKRMDNTLLWCSVTASVVCDEKGNLLYYDSSIEDITERKQIEKERKAERNRLVSLLAFKKEMLNTAVVWINTLDKEGNITLWNEAAEDISGYTAEEVMGSSAIWDILYPDAKYRGEIFKKSQEIIQSGKKIENFETQIRRKDGEYRTISWHSNRFFENEDIVGSIAIGADITDKKKVEDKLFEWHKLMQYIIQHDPNAIAVHDTELNYIYASERYLKDYRVKEQDIIGRHHYEVFPEIPQKWREVHERALAGEVLSSENDVFIRADGTFDYTRWECRPWYHSNGSIGGIILYTEVITKLKRAEAELQKLNRDLEERIRDRTFQLEAKNRELEKFTYSVSHDLKAPLRGIDGYSRLLLEDYTHKLDEEGCNFLHIIRHSAEQMNQLIDDLLAYSRMEQRLWQNKVLNIRSLAQSVAVEYFDEVHKCGGTLTLEIPDMSASVDPNGLAIALRNLLDNALKFAGSKSQPTIKIGGSKEENSFLLWVSDNGIGFDMKYHDRIFDIFNRLHRAEEYPGTGIGLAMVRKVVERMEGSLWAESKLGEGSTFYMEIPYAPEKNFKSGV